MGSWFGAGTAAGSESFLTDALANSNAADVSGFDKLLSQISTAQGLTGASAGSVPQFGAPSNSGVPQPQLIDLTQLMMQRR